MSLDKAADNLIDKPVSFIGGPRDGYRAIRRPLPLVIEFPVPRPVVFDIGGSSFEPLRRYEYRLERVHSRPVYVYVGIRG